MGVGVMHDRSQDRFGIEAEFESQVYHATSDELRALDEAELSGVASDEEVEAAFRTFRRI
jgi:hypothetical protein